jgi:tRNA threonylcarbamoyladenosine biosynthesis protein TsaB
MLILAIETTGPVSSVSLNRDGIITEIKNEDSYSHLQQLMPMVKKLMDEEEVKGEDLDAIAVSQGPGSFTGIRIGMVSAKGLAQVWDKPIVEVPTLASFAFRDYDWEEEGKRYLYCPVIDAKMHQVYAAAYEKNNPEAIVPGASYYIDEYLGLLEKAAVDYDAVVFFGDAYEVYADNIDAFDILHALAPEEDLCQSSFGTAVLGAKLFEEGKVKSCYDAQPEYFRLPEAERKFRTKSLRLLPAAKEDLGRIAEIEKAAFSDPWTEKMLEEDLEKSLSDERLLFLTAKDPEEGSEAVAFIIAYLIPETFAEIDDVATVPERRRQGIARKMMLEIISRAKEEKIDELVLEVKADNTPAICLYETLGFERTGYREAYYQDGSDAILMTKKL